MSPLFCLRSKTIYFKARVCYLKEYICSFTANEIRVVSNEFFCEKFHPYVIEYYIDY